MRAAPGRALMAPRVIARKSRRVDIAFALVGHERSRIRVNSVLIPAMTEVVVTEMGYPAQASKRGRPLLKPGRLSQNAPRRTIGMGDGSL
jgi:hypothetical protein